MKREKTELIAATMLLVMILFGLYLNKDNEKRIQAQIEKSIK